MKFKDWLNDWLIYSVKPTVKARTYEKYKEIVRSQLITYLGEHELDNLTADVLQSFVAEKSERYAPSTVNGIINVLRGALKRAEQMGYVERQYADSIQRPKYREKQITCFSQEEQKKIERYILNSNKPKLFGIVLCLYSGLRIGELMALTWEDIDFGKGMLRVTRTCRDTWKNGRYIKCFDSPKTVNSNRIIPIPKQILPMLRKIKQIAQNEYVVGGDARDVSIRSYQRTFALLLKKLSIKHCGFHSLRHTFATRALECGMDVKTLSELLGHQNPTITLRRYVHSLFEHKSSMMNRLGKMFG